MSTAHPERILVRLPSWVGDAVMATPVLRALRRAYPAARIVVEGRPLLQELLGGIASVDAFHADPGRGVRALGRRVETLRAERFDWAVLLPDSVRAALAPAIAGIPVRVGYARDPVRRALLTRPLALPRQGGRRLPIPMVERYLRIVRAMGCPDAEDHLELLVDAAERETLLERLRSLGRGGGEPLLALAPGASFGSSKLWPPAYFAAAADAIADRHGLRPVLAPAPAEVPLARQVAAAMKREPLVLDTPPIGLGELKALVAEARLLLTHDTGPRQLAVALDRPVVVVMGPTDPRHTASHLERQQVVREPVACSPCHLKRCPTDHRCMTHLRPERVVDAAAALIS